MKLAFSYKVRSQETLCLVVLKRSLPAVEAKFPGERDRLARMSLIEGIALMALPIYVLMNI